MLRLCKVFLQGMIIVFRPLLGFYSYKKPASLSACIYPLSCTTYAIEILNQKPLFIALFYIARRLLTCNPIGAYFVYRYNKNQQ